MPIFEFRCLECNREFEALVRKAAEISEIQCPECESRDLEELLSVFASNSKSGSPKAANCAPSGG